MGIYNIKINTVLPGWSASEYFSTEGQFLNSLGIDPEMPKDDSGTRPSGYLRPTSMAKFSGTEISGAPMWMVANNKDTNTYVYASDGKVHVVDSTLAMGTALNSGNAIKNGNGSGAVYYNNYLYLATSDDVARYGPLNGTPSLDTDYWNGTLSKTALANTTYPTIRGTSIPNHPMLVHKANNRLYFADVNSSGVGILSMINTVKGTYEGDTNSTVVPSSYNVLDTYYGWYITALESIGNEIAIGIIDGTNTSVKQGNAKVLFWDTLPSSTSYSRIAELPDPLITGLKTVNGVLYAFTGSASGGMRVLRYVGGQQFEELYYADDNLPPFQGAIDSQVNRIVWGTSTTTPAASASVMSLGSKVRALAMGVHNIIKATSAGANPLLTSLQYKQQGPTKQPMVGWKDDSAKGLDKISTTYGTSIWRSQMFNVGKSGYVKHIRIPLAQALATNMTITAKIYLDDGSSSVTLPVINSTNYSGRFVSIYPDAAQFKNNFYIELTWSGSALATVALPIELQIESISD